MQKNTGWPIKKFHFDVRSPKAKSSVGGITTTNKLQLLF